MAAAPRRRSGSSKKGGQSQMAILLVGLGVAGFMICGLIGVVVFLVLKSNAGTVVQDDSLADNAQPFQPGQEQPQATSPSDNYSSDDASSFTVPVGLPSSSTAPSSHGDQEMQTFLDRYAEIQDRGTQVMLESQAESNRRLEATTRAVMAMDRRSGLDEPTREFEISSPPAGQFLLGVKTNAYGCVVVVEDMSDGAQVELFDQFNIQSGLVVSRAISPRKPVKLTVSFGSESKVVENILVNADQKQLVDMQFDESQLQRIRKAATCLINIPDGGFGSGFLFHDRQTIATAAHCVAAENIGELEFVFDPTEPSEERFKGARLMHYDRPMDVALLRLPEPVPMHRPFLHTGADNAEKGNKVVIVGNPGRFGKPDPTFTRSGEVAGGRADEFYLDLELKPGFSGGPVCLAASNQAVGIVSYKIVESEEYEAVGRSYAKSADLVGDTYEHFVSLTASGQTDRLDRLEAGYEEQYLMGLAGQAALDMFLDSTVYLVICRSVAVDYIQYMAEAEARINPSAPLVVRRRAEKAASDKYMKEVAPKLAKEVRDKVTPQLRMTDSKSYERAMANEKLDPAMKRRLETAHENFAQLKEAAEKITSVGTSTKGRSLEEFVEWIHELYSDGRTACLSIMVTAEIVSDR